MQVTTTSKPPKPSLSPATNSNHPTHTPNPKTPFNSKPPQFKTLQQPLVTHQNQTSLHNQKPNQHNQTPKPTTNSQNHIPIQISKIRIIIFPKPKKPKIQKLKKL
ncbi:hypothetical protein KC19_1G058400 [Ceratodon purpureus]|uniref:Uncharacterized protein n=1 Tax=Ceratodon purpureus TaxID=3225 RepID=A0A8T0J203_CERPU|nr:hypothetical protein KC19_1G058400 [Ceratodon purpureus]